MRHGGGASRTAIPNDAQSRSGHRRRRELPSNLPKMSSAHARIPSENETHAQAWHHVMTIPHQCLGNIQSRETLKDDATGSHTLARTTLCQCSHALSACDNAAARHLMDDISEHVHEDNDAHAAIRGPRRALPGSSCLRDDLELKPEGIFYSHLHKTL